VVTDAGRAAALRASLAEALEQDGQRATTSFGPHHDELELSIDGKDARRFASQGQQRCLALALTLGVVDAVHHARGRPPLVLLDDVSSELDEHRRRALFGALARAGCQVMATATDLSLLPVPPVPGLYVTHLKAHGGVFQAEVGPV
jgi:DNA replication and repair protein RecF